MCFFRIGISNSGKLQSTETFWSLGWYSTQPASEALQPLLHCLLTWFVSSTGFPVLWFPFVTWALSYYGPNMDWINLKLFTVGKMDWINLKLYRESTLLVTWKTLLKSPCLSLMKDRSQRIMMFRCDSCDVLSVWHCFAKLIYTQCRLQTIFFHTIVESWCLVLLSKGCTE